MPLSPEILIGFAVAHLLAAATPGPNFFLVSNLATSKSRKHGLFAAFGIVISVAIWSSSAAAGLNVFLDRYPIAYSVLRYMGAVYLIWLGYQLVRSAFRPMATQQMSLDKGMQTSIISAVRKGFLVNILNPKTIVYYTSVFSVLVPVNASSDAFYEILITAVAVSSIWWCSVAIVFSTVIARNMFSSILRYIEIVAGGAFVFFGARLVVQ